MGKTSGRGRPGPFLKVMPARRQPGPVASRQLRGVKVRCGVRRCAPGAGLSGMLHEGGAVDVERGVGKIPRGEGGEAAALHAGDGVPLCEGVAGEVSGDEQGLGAQEVARMGAEPSAGGPGAGGAGERWII